MNLFSIGISHHTASVDVRERMWLSNEEIKAALLRLRETHFQECVLVSTCNRTELYGLSPAPLPTDLPLRSFLIEFKRAGDAVTSSHFAAAQNQEAIGHLFEVASGIDSLVIGDIQILNQVKDAFNIAREAGALGPVLGRLMQTALHVGKRVRTETTICEGAVSVSYAAVELAGKIFADLSKKTVLLIGAGETGELTLKHLQGKGIGSILVANRTRSRAEELVAAFGGTVVDYEQMLDGLRRADIVISSVNAPAYVVQPEDVSKVMKQRSNNPLFLIDIGVPRNVNPAARKIENVFLYDMDSLSAIVDRNVDRRRAEIPRVKSIIGVELESFLRWEKSLEVGPAIQEFREALELIRRTEVEKNANRFHPEDRELLEMITRRIVNKILHQPTTVLKQGAEEGGNNAATIERVNALRELFGFSPSGKE
jgi:glutamyl-tRNA reductase